MKEIFHLYTDADFQRVRAFVIDSNRWAYQSWGISRFNFCHGLIPEFKQSHGYWHRSVGIWEDGEGIAAMALNEADTDHEGGVFFQFRSREDETEELLERMFSFAETHMGKYGDDRTTYTVNLRIGQDDETIQRMALARGYSKTGDAERILVLPFAGTPFPVDIPDGFRIGDGRTVPALYQAMAHMHSFRYGPPHSQRAVKAFQTLREMPDYRPELDLCMLDAEGRPAGLAIVWYDAKNSICELEPLGTVWWYRRMGIGRALIHEAANRAMRLGPCRGMVGGDQQFYWSLGFEPVYSHEIWTWRNE